MLKITNREGRINHLVGPHTHNAGALLESSTPKRREGGEGCPQPNRGLGRQGSVVYAPQWEKYITDDKDFGNF